MAQIDLVELVRQAILPGAMVLLPVLSVAFLSSLFVGLLQAATGIHEPLVGMVPRLAVMAAALVFAMPWMIEQMVEFLKISASVHSGF